MSSEASGMSGRRTALDEGRVPEGYRVQREGCAGMTYRADDKVFYNPVQVANRDLSVAVLRVTSQSAPQPLRVLEALSATGLRALRYWQEVEGLAHVVANDLQPAAVECIRRNVAVHGVSEEHVRASQADATQLMMRSRGEFEVVDLDPYGSVAPFVDAAVQSVADGGLLCVTSTDMMNLAGKNVDVCAMRYGCVPLKGAPYIKEGAVRIVLAMLERAANVYRRTIEPLLCLQIDFYVRLFVRVRTSGARAKVGASRLSSVYHCDACGSHRLLPLLQRKVLSSAGGEREKYVAPRAADILGEHGLQCSECGGQLRVGGPLYSAPIRDDAFVEALQAHLDSHAAEYASHRKIAALVRTAAAELPDVPLHYDLAKMVALVKCSAQPTLRLVQSALVRAGHRVSGCHTEPNALKTDASPTQVWDLMRAWTRDHPPVHAPALDSPAARILAKKDLPLVDFTPLDDNLLPLKGPRFIPNPPHWGPGTRNTIHTRGSDNSDPGNPLESPPKKLKIDPLVD